ncbi:alpha/beta fold hydrolase [Bacteroidota bacterium]
MKHYLSLLMFGLFIITLITGCKTDQREVPYYTIQDFLGTTTFTGASFSPDNSKILVSSNKTGIFNAYSIPVSGGEPTQLTNSAENSIFVRGYFPDSERFLYSSDQGGNELNHIYIQELNGSVTDLTPGDKLKARYYDWAWDDKTFYIATNERDPKYFDVYEYSPKDYSREMIFQNDEGYNFADVSPDRKFIVLSKTKTTTNSDMFLYNTETKEITLISEHEGEVIHSPQSFSPDGRSLYFLTDKNSEFKYLARYELETSKSETVIKPNWDIRYAFFSNKGKYLIVGINNDAQTELQVYDAATMKQFDLPKVKNAEVTSVSMSRDESQMAFYVSASNIPSDLFYSDFSSEPKQLTRSLNPNINADNLVNAKVVRFKSFDGVEIPGILYKPHQANSKNKAPALVWVHGGPGGQSRVGYNAMIQYLVNHGYVIYAINNRGSSGYGKTFYKMDDRKHGEGDLDDCVASKQMLTETDYVDSDRIGIIGGSYGGYMVLAALAFRPEEFAVGVDIFGVANWYRTVQNIPPWWESMRKALEVELGDFDDEEYFRSISPLFHADKITKPLIVLQGANDPRVLKIESDEMVEVTRKNGVEVEYIVFDDEGHGFRKNKNRERGYKAILDFLNKYLKKTDGAS